MARLRQPAVAGMFYDGTPGILGEHIDLLIEESHGAEPAGTIVGLIAPHAGYMYSGPAAAAGYRALQGKSYDCVILVGPSHRDFFSGVSIYPGDGYRTPLGELRINKPVRDALLKESEIITLSDAGHGAEHCLEVQLPFLQRVLGQFTFVPMIIGDQTAETCLDLGRAIAEVARGLNALLIASSDLSHYHPYDAAVRLDRRVIDAVEAFDEVALMHQIEHEQLEACGGGPIVAVMRASKMLGALRSQSLFYCNSGDVTGDKSGVVGYLSAAFLK